MFSDYKGFKQGINNKKISRESPSIGKLNKTLLNSHRSERSQGNLENILN